MVLGWATFCQTDLSLAKEKEKEEEQKEQEAQGWQGQEEQEEQGKQEEKEEEYLGYISQCVMMGVCVCSCLFDVKFKRFVFKFQLGMRSWRASATDSWNYLKINKIIHYHYHRLC